MVPTIQSLKTATWLEVRAVSNPQRVNHLERDSNLDPGEANVIALALELQATQLLIDERLGRKEAKRQGLKIIGILGILLAAKQQKLISTVGPIMDALIHHCRFEDFGQQK